MGINPRNLKTRISTTPLQSGVAIVAITAAALFGAYLDKVENSRYVRFRDKSMLYGKPKSEGEAPSWGGDYWSFCK